MADEQKPIKKDATGYEVITNAMKDLLNQFPGLLPGETVKYEELGTDSGIAFSNDAGALVYAERKDIIGGIHQTCQYPFFIVYRAAGSAKERQKMSIQEFLDAFGKWLCQEPAIIDGVQYQLIGYPKLSGSRQIQEITRDNSYGTEPQENGVQDWLLPVTVQYRNDFKKQSQTPDAEPEG